jgi:hypothetical protein
MWNVQCFFFLLLFSFFSMCVQGLMLLFFKYFRQKIQQKKLAFLTQNKAKLCKVLIIGFREKRQFFAENCRKSLKIVIVTSTPDLQLNFCINYHFFTCCKYRLCLVHWKSLLFPHSFLTIFKLHLFLTIKIPPHYFSPIHSSMPHLFWVCI